MKKALFLALAGLSFAAVAVAQAPADIVYPNAAVGNTTFSHSLHSDGKGMACTDCHTAIFQMAKNSAKITMADMNADMNAGKYCGTCHKAGGKAFAATDCAKCHKK